MLQEAFHILGFTQEEILDVYKISAMCMHISRLEFTGHGDMSTGNLKNGAGETLMELFQYCGAADELYDRFCNPKIKVILNNETQIDNLDFVVQ